MKHKDISFNKEMLIATRENRKTATRRIIKKVPPNTESIERHSSSANCGLFVAKNKSGQEVFIKCNYTLGMILRVREDNDLLLRVTSVRAERVQDITENEAIKEGVKSKLLFLDLISSIYPNCNSDSWVWVVEFQRVK